MNTGRRLHCLHGLLPLVEALRLLKLLLQALPRLLGKQQLPMGGCRAGRPVPGSGSGGGGAGVSIDLQHTWLPKLFSQV